MAPVANLMTLGATIQVLETGKQDDCFEVEAVITRSPASNLVLAAFAYFGSFR